MPSAGLARCTEHGHIWRMSESGSAKKKEFLVVHDYGTGGVWAVIRARSAEEITAKFRDVDVFERRPAWMTRVSYDSLKRKESYDIDQPTGLFFPFPRRKETQTPS